MSRGVIRVPSWRGRLGARSSVQRVLRHSLGWKAPRGYGWLTNPKKAAYNRYYRRTSVRFDDLLSPGVLWCLALIYFGLYWLGH